ncbi:MAG: MotA/TolQ/ExbB proton channel family protein [Cystobacterineae bacterium]|nr:MotA/TolQ/ExbB proton channel family protein [Cystobacterineae bacterium]
MFIQGSAPLASAGELGWLTKALLGVTLGSVEWVLWLLVVLSVASVAVMLERGVFYWLRSLRGTAELFSLLANAQWEKAKALLKGQKGLEANTLGVGLSLIKANPKTAEENMSAALAKGKIGFERYLSFLGTLGSNAPFIGLFGTVLGIIKAFHELGKTNVQGADMQQTIMTGISEALVATAVGLAVAIPAVVAFNIFTRALKSRVGRTQALAHLLLGGMGQHTTPEAPSSAEATPGEAPMGEGKMGEGKMGEGKMGEGKTA